MRSGQQLKDSVYERIRAAILSGELPPGTPLSRRKLAESLGVSTVPVTAALERLSADRLVESRPRAGTRVRLPSPKEVRGNYILREALETHSARLFAESASPAARRALIEKARKLDEAYQRVSNGSRARQRAERLHLEFHTSIARAAGCAELVEAIANSRVLLLNWLVSHSAVFRPLPPDWHFRLACSLGNSSPEKAAEAMRAHVRFRIDEVTRHFEKFPAPPARGRIARGPRTQPPVCGKI